ncbi:FBXO9 [Branchiostoma lanceolatum]|uniref:F-box only protein 9 n=1 Tax=Branchiostoma lanceolatum TaxID=7740 RepID=A0A8J9VZI1_BRALA|nr:FBXO9 [Branchiostoma lanceolatum]
MDGEGNANVPLGSDETAGDEDDEESSSSARAGVDLQAELDNFRARWRDELTSSPELSHKQQQRRKRQDSESDDDFNQDLEERAKRLFLRGVSAEQDGNLHDAVKFYKQAIQLVPDIESHITDYSEQKSDDESDSSDDEDLLSPDIEDADLLSQFHRLAVSDGRLCQPELPLRMTHISALPTELLTYIFRWVVSSNLDMRSLERLALVCRGFYVCARDPEIWRQACLRVWGINCGTPSLYGSWRDMYINRPHFRYDGVYISKTSYVRPGEQGLDTFYRPFHMVEYYRYMRFFPDGTMLLLTSADEPYGIVPKLRGKGTSMTGMYTGHYRLQGDKMAAFLKKRNPYEQNQYYRYTRGYGRSRENVPQTEQSFHVEMRLADVGQRKNAKLIWLRYSCQILNKRTRTTSVTDFDIDMKYPPLVFSRVKSYMTAAESPL